MAFVSGSPRPARAGEPQAVHTSVGRRRGRLLPAVVMLLLAVGVSAAWIGLRLGGPGAARDFDDAATALAAVLATGLCGRAAGRDRAQARLFWSLLAAACFCWTLAEIVWGLYEVVLRVPVPVVSWADVGYLGAIPFAVAALWWHPSMGSKRTQRLRSLLDSLIVATALAFLSWTLVMGPVWHSSDLSTMGGLVAVAYPFGDAVILIFIVTAVRRMTGSGRRPLWILLVGLLVMAVSDSTYTYLSTTNSYTSGGLIDVGWIVAYLTIALAAFTAQPTPLRSMRAIATARPTLTAFVAPFAPALLALGVAGIELQLGHHLDTPSKGGAFAVVALVLIRQTLLARDVLGAPHDSDAQLIAELGRTALGRSEPSSPVSSTRRGSR